MISGFIYLLSLFFLTEIIDSSTYPRAIRSFKSVGFRHLPPIGLFGLMAATTGSYSVSLIVVVFVEVALSIGSSIKFHLLDEPVVFSDLVVLLSFLREPKFYLHAVPKGTLLAACILLPLALYGFVIASIQGNNAIRLLGVALLGLASLLLRKALTKQQLVQAPALLSDIKTYGLFATLVIYGWEWQRSPDPGLPPPLSLSLDLPDLVIVQCESFCDPNILFEDLEILPHLAAARKNAFLSGTLSASGYGAYTMRSEFGVICGRDEESLKFRFFDPFLKAESEKRWALPNRLATSYQNPTFLHPHDLRFYGRAGILPRWGFKTIIGHEQFKDAERVGPYVSDACFGQKLKAQLTQETNARFVYGVTMENHGPWKAGRCEAGSAVEAYRMHLRNSDALLGSLMGYFSAGGRNTLFVFFGDHRPSLPTDVPPHKGRQTPYVILNYENGVPARRDNQASLTPAELNAMILSILSGSPLQPPKIDA